jgi:hypothetical protein
MERMARKMPGRQIARPAQGKNEFTGTRARRRNIVKPLVRTTVHARPAKRVFG